MSRVKGGVKTHARHRKIVKAAKGYYGRRKSVFKVATQAVDKANQYATRDRKNRKRNFRALWIQRINAAVRSHDEALTYSRFINGKIINYSSSLDNVGVFNDARDLSWIVLLVNKG